MTQESMPATTPSTGHVETSAALYMTFTVTAAFVAASAAGLSFAWGLAPWAMFMGWVAYFTRKPSLAEGLRTFACLLIGLSLGAIATLGVGMLAPTLGSFALPASVFIVGLIVIAARGLPVLNNLLGYFIGLITFFAAHLEPALSNIAELAAAAGFGSLAGWVAQSVEGRFRKAVHA